MATKVLNPNRKGPVDNSKISHLCFHTEEEKEPQTTGERKLSDHKYQTINNQFSF